VKSKGSFHFQIKYDAKASRRQYQPYGKGEAGKVSFDLKKESDIFYSAKKDNSDGANHLAIFKAVSLLFWLKWKKKEYFSTAGIAFNRLGWP
jgi:hypothetical protein